MSIVKLEVQLDHLDKIAGTDPLKGIIELIWNGLDADAEQVQVDFEKNDLGEIDIVRVTDNGTGIPLKEAEIFFEHLGGSWKKDCAVTKQKKRVIHGKEGKGRLKSLAIGHTVTWTSHTKQGDNEESIRISYSRLNHNQFDIQTLTTNGNTRTLGTTTEIRHIETDTGKLTAPNASQRLAEEFALYLSRYPSVTIVYDGSLIDPVSAQLRKDEFSLPSLSLPNHPNLPCKLIVLEWKVPTERKLYLCNAYGMALLDVPMSVRAPGFEFTAYINTKYNSILQENNTLDTAELDKNINQAIENARDQIREHFRKRRAEEAASIVDIWKKEEVYPYTNEPATILEKAERQVFDIVALHVHAYLPKFERLEPMQKKLALHLLRHVVESDASIQSVLSNCA